MVIETVKAGPLPLHVAVVADERLIERVGDRQLALAGKGVGDGRDHEARLDAYELGPDGGVLVGRLTEGHVDVAQPGPCRSARKRQFLEAHPDVRMLVGESRKQRPLLDHWPGTDEANCQLVARLARERVGHHVGVVDRRERDARFGKESLSDGRELHAAGMPLKQSHSQLSLQGGDRLRQRRLGEMQPGRRARHLSLLGDGDEVAQMSQTCYGKAPRV